MNELCRAACRFQGQGHSGGEDRIQEFGGIAGHGPAGPVEPIDGGGPAFQLHRLEDGRRALQSPPRVVIFPKEAEEPIAIAPRGAVVYRSLHLQTDRSAAIGEWDDPGPGAARVNADPDISLRIARRSLVRLDPGEEREARSEHRRPLQLQESRQDAAITAAVEHETSAQPHWQLALQIGGGHLHLIREEFNRAYAMAEANI